MIFPLPSLYTDPRAWPEIVVYVATVFLEAEGEPGDGRLAVAWVIRNRMDRRRASPAEICLARMQFSCWNTDYEAQRTARLTAPDASVWDECWRVSVGAYARLLPDASGGADHYLNPDLTRTIRGGSLPPWYDEAKITVVRGRHHFLHLWR